MVSKRLGARSILSGTTLVCGFGSPLSCCVLTLKRLKNERSMDELVGWLLTWVLRSELVGSMLWRVEASLLTNLDRTGFSFHQLICDVLSRWELSCDRWSSEKLGSGAGPDTRSLQLSP